MGCGQDISCYQGQSCTTNGFLAVLEEDSVVLQCELKERHKHGNFKYS